MVKIVEGAYFAECSDLKVVIKKIYYSNSEYMRCKVHIININNGIDYGETKEKIYFKNITHWQQFVF